MSESGHRDVDLLVLGLAVRRMREQRDMSAGELADACAIDRQRIDALESGQIDPPYELLLAVAEGLGTQPSTLVTNEL